MEAQCTQTDKLVEWWRDYQMPFLLKDTQMLASLVHLLQTGVNLFFLPLTFWWAVPRNLSSCSQSRSSLLLSCSILFLLSSRFRPQGFQCSGLCTFSVTWVVVVSWLLGLIVEKDLRIQPHCVETCKPSPLSAP